MGTSRFFYRLLCHKCTVQTWSSDADDDFGQPIKDWANLFTDKACRVWRQETGRPFEVTNPLTGEMITAEFEVFMPLDKDTWDSSTKRPTFDEQASVIIETPYDLTLNVELVSVRAEKGTEHHLEIYLSRQVR